MNKQTKVAAFFFASFFVLAVVAFGNFISSSPSACSGNWTNCDRAFADDSNRATAIATNTVNKTGEWTGYGFSVPSSASIDTVGLRADFFASDIYGFANIRVSGDGGSTFGPDHIIGGNTVEQSYLIDVTSDRTWTADMVDNDSFVVEATCFKSAGGTGKLTACRLDWIPANVTYTPFDFSVSTNPTSGTIEQGSNTTTNVTVTLLGGTPQTVTLSQTGCPVTATCTFSPSNMGSPTFSRILTITTTANTTPGNYTINITGTGDGKTRSVIYTLVVQSAFDFSIAASPSSASIEQGKNGTTNITATLTSGTTENVSLSVVGCPVAATCSFSSSSGFPTFTRVLKVATAANTTPGTYQMNVTGTSATKTHTTTYTLTVTSPPVFNFSVSVNPSYQTIPRGSSNTTNVTVTLLSGTPQTVTLSQSGCSGVANCFFVPSSGTPTFSSSLTVAPFNTSIPGNYTINITGTAGAVTKTAFYTLTVV